MQYKASQASTLASCGTEGAPIITEQSATRTKPIHQHDCLLMPLKGQLTGLSAAAKSSLNDRPINILLYTHHTAPASASFPRAGARRRKKEERTISCVPAPTRYS